ncbi:diguanylate cyclase domain-containing protein [Novosphingobium sp. Rr 2-17]|uniref:diguanylate cyclase domain-containing protein n=1 Tax=Novosphingobium sp. Rr 2-17 TaxID=555793 RepID=UPI002351C39C|nr:diguanylate cyclase [Novosphingobium sp. Rr 2-17]
MGAWACDLRTERLSWTPAVFDMFGLPRHKHPERYDTIGMYAEPSRAMLERLRSAAIAKSGTFSLEAQIFRPDGEERWIRVKAATKVQNGHAVTLYGMKEDITVERKRWEQLRRATEFDALTGLAKRAQFQARFLDGIPGSEALASLSALALFDLGNLREINRLWGLAAGDACLVAFARRLLAAYPDAALAARLSGGEFAILLNGDASAKARGTHNLLSSLVDPVLWRGSAIPIHASVGMAFLRQRRNFEAEALYTQAAAALEAAKKKQGHGMRVAAVDFPESARLSSDISASMQIRTNFDNFQLSPRETEVLRHIARGGSTDEIAQAMGVSRHTVRNFIRRMYQKMQVGGRVEATRLAAQHGML